MKVIYSRRAMADLIEIFDYVAAQDVATAMAVEDDLRLACEGLAQFPYANPRTDITTVFRMPLRDRGFTVFYRVKRRADVVEIIRVVRAGRVRSLQRAPRQATGRARSASVTLPPGTASHPLPLAGPCLYLSP